jgi:hypothetical protein
MLKIKKCPLLPDHKEIHTQMILCDFGLCSEMRQPRKLEAEPVSTDIRLCKLFYKILLILV